MNVSASKADHFVTLVAQGNLSLADRAEVRAHVAVPDQHALRVTARAYLRALPQAVQATGSPDVGFLRICPTRLKHPQTQQRRAQTCGDQSHNEHASIARPSREPAAQERRQRL